MSFWSDRLHGLFDLGYEFENKSVLDLGCSFGIVGYEVCKRKPSRYHGVEMNSKAFNCATEIISRTDVRDWTFDCYDLAHNYPIDHFDVTLCLGLFQHVRRRLTDPRPWIHKVADQSEEAIIVRAPVEDLHDFTKFAETLGFELETEIRDGRFSPIRLLRRLN